MVARGGYFIPFARLKERISSWRLNRLIGERPDRPCTLSCVVYCERCFTRLVKMATISPKKLSWILRHSPPDTGIKVYPGGFLRIRDFTTRVRAAIDIIINDDEDRFEFISKMNLNGETINGPFARATQGHSFEFEESEEWPLFAPLPVGYCRVFHQTSASNLKSILANGLNRCNRTYIHTSLKKPNPSRKGQVVIEIDLDVAEALGLTFVVSKNGSALTRGNENHVIPPECFALTWTVLDDQWQKCQELPLYAKWVAAQTSANAASDEFDQLSSTPTESDVMKLTQLHIDNQSESMESIMN